jgi:HD superfamily phosphohydrolase
LDESVILYYFQIWQEEADPILRDLCGRFVNRNLFKYTEFDPAKEYKKLAKLTLLFEKAGMDPEYYLVVDSSSDLPYDFYRPGEEEERLPINLLMKNNDLRELSRESEIVEAISGKRRTDHKLYYPADFLEDDLTQKELKKQIRALLE